MSVDSPKVKETGLAFEQFCTNDISNGSQHLGITKLTAKPENSKPTKFDDYSVYAHLG